MKNKKEHSQFAGFVSILLSFALILATMASPSAPARASSRPGQTGTSIAATGALDTDDNFNLLQEDRPSHSANRHASWTRPAQLGRRQLQQ